MNRKEFMNKLTKLLKKLPEEHKREVLEFYEEYFDEAGAENEKSVLEELKSPEHLAAKILAEYAQKHLAINSNLDDKNNKENSENLKKSSEQKKLKSKKFIRINAFWFGVLAVLSAPITIPLTIALLSVLFALSIVVLVLIPVMALMVIALLIAFIFSIFVVPLQALYFLAWIIILFGFIKLFLVVAKAGLNRIFTKIKSL